MKKYLFASSFLFIMQLFCYNAISATFIDPTDGTKLGNCEYSDITCATKNHHTGQDYDDNNSLAIKASNEGKIVHVETMWYSGPGVSDHGMGTNIIIEHQLNDNSKIYTSYSHLSSIANDIYEGACVTIGQNIGTMGGSGYGNPNYWGRHLHFEFKYTPVTGAPWGGNYWGYTPNIPDNYGYANPYSFIGIVNAKNHPDCYGSMSVNYLGTWNGNGVQNNSVTWSILLTIAEGDVGSIVGTIAYPSLRCGGTLRLNRMTSNSIVLFEDLTYGTSSCVDDGTVTLYFNSQNTLGYYWEKGSSNAVGNLNKVSQGNNDNTISNYYLGTWSGSGVQNDSSRWTILLTLAGGDVGSNVGTISYPSLRCGGTLILKSVTPSSIVLVENITYGNNCIDGGDITLNFKSQNTIGYYWEKGSNYSFGNIERISGYQQLHRKPFPWTMFLPAISGAQ